MVDMVDVSQWIVCGASGDSASRRADDRASAAAASSRQPADSPTHAAAVGGAPVPLTGLVLAQELGAAGGEQQRAHRPGQQRAAEPEGQHLARQLLDLIGGLGRRRRRRRSTTRRRLCGGCRRAAAAAAAAAPSFCCVGWMIVTGLTIAAHQPRGGALSSVGDGRAPAPPRRGPCHGRRRRAGASLAWLAEQLRAGVADRIGAQPAAVARLRRWPQPVPRRRCVCAPPHCDTLDIYTIPASQVSRSKSCLD
jgi:hypothetical protein